jgi:hypothetical protein
MRPVKGRRTQLGPLCVVFLEKQGKERTGKLEAFSQDAGGHGADVDFLSVVNFACEWRSGDRKAIVVHADSVRADFTRSELGRERVPRTSGYFDRQIGRRTCAEGTKIPNDVKAQSGKRRRILPLTATANSELDVPSTVISN